MMIVIGSVLFCKNEFLVINILYSLENDCPYKTIRKMFLKTFILINIKHLKIVMSDKCFLSVPLFVITLRGIRFQYKNVLKSFLKYLCY